MARSRCDVRSRHRSVGSSSSGKLASVAEQAPDAQGILGLGQTGEARGVGSGFTHDRSPRERTCINRLAATMESHPHGAERYPSQPSHLFAGQLFELIENQRGAINVGQPIEGLVQPRALLAPFELVMRRPGFRRHEVDSGSVRTANGEAGSCAVWSIPRAG
jgi:hypothetical protein